MGKKFDEFRQEVKRRIDDSDIMLRKFKQMEEKKGLPLDQQLQVLKDMETQVEKLQDAVRKYRSFFCPNCMATGIIALSFSTTRECPVCKGNGILD